jgi:predicted nucleotidyltransferase
LDLLAETTHPVRLMQRAALKRELEGTLTLPVDLSFAESGKAFSTFQAMIKAHAQPLGEPVR